MEKIKIEEWIKNNPKNYGSGYGSGSGDGYGYGSGDGIGSFDGQDIYMIDDLQTIITFIKDNVAKGYVLESDFSLKPCFVLKGNGYFAHGKTLKEAQDSLHEKIFENMEPEEAINAFLEKFKKGEKYKGSDFFEWHHYLTGSCLMGRESFVRSHGLNVEDSFTVDEFISICENDYGSEIIKQLKERWNDL